MERIGFIREKREIKFLILYVMEFLSAPIDEASLLDICLIDDGFGYMEFSEAFNELIDSSHVVCEPGVSPKKYIITDKGKDVASLFEQQLPLSIREKAKLAAMNSLLYSNLAEGVKVSVIQKQSGRYSIHLSLGKEADPILALTLTTINKAQCDLIESNFRKNPEVVYNLILKMLMDSSFMENYKSQS